MSFGRSMLRSHRIGSGFRCLEEDPFDPVQNIHQGQATLASLTAMVHGMSAGTEGLSCTSLALPLQACLGGLAAQYRTRPMQCVHCMTAIASGVCACL